MNLALAADDWDQSLSAHLLYPGHGQRGRLLRVYTSCTCREKIWAAADFQNFLARSNSRRPRKKEVRKRRASIYRTSPSDAVDYFLVSHVITSIVVIEFVISKNRRLGAISTTLNGHLLETVAWSSSLSSTSSSRNVKTAASFCRCTRSAGAYRHGSSSERASWVSFLHQVGSFAAPFGLGAAALAWCVFMWIVTSIERAIALYHHGLQEAVVSLVLSGHNVFFQGARRQSLGKSVVMRTLRKEQSCR